MIKCYKEVMEINFYRLKRRNRICTLQHNELFRRKSAIGIVESLIHVRLVWRG